MLKGGLIELRSQRSLPVWGRGLKYDGKWHVRALAKVAPRVGAWIEMDERASPEIKVWSRSPCGGVD